MIAGAAIGVAGVGTALAQVEPVLPRGEAGPSVAKDAISGRTFAGQRLPLAAVTGSVEFRARRAWAWSEPGDVPGSGPVTRLLLREDVRVALGSYEFQATGAAVWLEKVATEGTTTGGTYQVFVYFDGVTTPEADAAFALAADRLPVRAVVTTESVVLKADRVERARPQDLLIAEGETELREQILAMLYPPPPPPPPTPPSPRPTRPGPTEVTESPRRQEDAARDERIAREEPARREGEDGRPVAMLDTPGSPSRPEERGAHEAAEQRIAERTERAPIVGTIAPAEAAAAREAVQTMAPAERTEPLAGASGVVTFATSADISIVRGEEENTIVFPGRIVVQYWDRTTGRTVQISADRGVAFLEPGPLTQLANLDADGVRGVYLEGGVMIVGEGPTPRGRDRFMFRGPSAYYDFRTDRALTLDATFWTYDTALGMPLYVRADAVRQESANQWSAKRAQVANTAFLNPQLSIGTTSITLERRVTPDGEYTYADAKNITGRVGPVPVVWWPRFKGDPSTIPIREVRLDGSSGSGGAFKTRWDLYSLIGVERPSWLDATLALDYYFERGPAIGGTADWSTSTTKGRVDGYLVASDTGQDVLKSGRKKDFDGETRGFIEAEHRWQISEAWSVILEGTYISDETFIDGFFENLGETRREFTNSATARRLGTNSLLTIQARGSFTDFLPNEYLLQSQGYSVNKVPEATYTRVGDELFQDRWPGLAMYHSEFRLSRMSLNFSEPTAADLGYNQNFRSQRAFGTAPGVSMADVLTAAGYTDDAVNRFDTRHEIETVLRAGPVNFEPFLVGRFTAYDDTFEEFSPGNNEDGRWWGAAGVRASTSFQRVNNSVESSLFDLHRMRHIVEPSLTLWTAETNVESANLPVYDSTVEDLADGTAARIGLSQTWQTQRGGPGRWKNTDVFTLDVEYVTFSDDADRKSPIRRFIDFRPEFSQPGEFFSVDSTWQMTEVVALGGNIIYDMETNQPARESVGLITQHTPDVTSYVEMRYINSEDSTFLNFGATARITPKYTASLNVSYDSDEGNVQNVSLTLNREMQAFYLQGTIAYNNITSETNVGLTFFPIGVGRGRGLQVTPVGMADVRALEPGTVRR